MRHHYGLYGLIGCLLLLSSLASSLPAYGEMKIVERSSKKAPEWVMQHPSDYLVAISSAPTLQEAQSRVEQELLRKVMSAIAVNVEGETVTDSGVENDKEWDNFYSTISVRAARLPFVSDISLAKSKDTYWEHFHDKDGSSDRYDMYVLYPFDSSTRRKLIGEYEAYDSKMESSLQRLENGWDDVAGYEELAKAEGDLEGLKAWFPDNLRRKRAEKTLDLYRSIKKSLSLVGEIVGKGECRVRVMRGDRVFKIQGRLEVSSNCASAIAVSPEGDGWKVTFNTDDCLEDEDNTLTLTVKGVGTKLKSTVNI